MKSRAEYNLRLTFKMQQLVTDTLNTESTDKKMVEKKRYAYFQDNASILEGYSSLRIEIDELITQLKADLTISNKKKLIRQLNAGVSDSSSWYHTKISKVKDAYQILMSHYVQGFDASLSDVTALFSALVGVVTGARDFRAQQIKALCEQLEALRLADPFDFMEGAATKPKAETATKDKA